MRTLYGSSSGYPFLDITQKYIVISKSAFFNKQTLSEGLSATTETCLHSNGSLERVEAENREIRKISHTSDKYLANIENNQDRQNLDILLF